MGGGSGGDETDGNYGRRELGPFPKPRLSLSFPAILSRWLPPTGGQMQKSPIVMLATRGNFSPCLSSFNPHIEYLGSASQTLYITAVLAEKASVTRAQTIRSTTQPRYLVLLRTSLGLNQLNELSESMP